MNSVRKLRTSIISSIALAICLLILTSTVSAQNLVEKDPGTTLSHIPIPVAVEVDDFISLSSNIGTGLQVNLSLKNIDDYENGVSLNMPNHIVVSSNQRFSLLARAAYKDFTSAGSPAFPSNILGIQIKNTDISGTGLSLQNIPGLEINDQVLIENAAPSIKKYLNIEYSISSKNAINKILGIGGGIYTNTIIYTLSAL
ncbi:hypothetical protein [Albibacterium bauzanense]|uniref:Uncharacterized protein n=1 Tax=Albibacterium bauzanense TaxID=653929 RepID=A0A4R1M0I9_9SPHI|nr:hypothetical protein [Albibacterium bauzanense]TCK85125.1 hypothetical protein C8N28_0423 [Albibacterium bauzanense]